MTNTKASNTKRLISILLTLCMALALVPAFPLTASAAAPVDPTSTATWDFLTADADGNGTDGGTGTWDWVQSTKTLTLTNITHSTSASTALEVPSDTTIVLIGTNEITSTFSGANPSFGVLAGSVLNITGSGSLTATGGTAGANYSVGIWSTGLIAITGGAIVTAVGGDVTVSGVQSRGVRVGTSGSITVSGGANLTATGGVASGGSWGVYIESTATLTVDGGTLLATGNTRALYSNFTVPDGHAYTVSSTTDGLTTPATGTGGSFEVTSAHKYAKITPPAPTTVTFTAAQTGGTSDTADSTGIVLTFSTLVSGLAASDITITNGTGAVVKGYAVSEPGTIPNTTWTMPLSSITTQGNVTVSVKNFGTFNVTTTPQTVAVYKAGYAINVTAPLATASEGTVFLFDTAPVGYAPRAATTFTISNTGALAMTDLAVASLTGANAGSFTLAAGSVNPALASGGTTTFTIKPNDSLTEDIYTATVTISDTNLPTDYTFDISFTVSTFAVSVTSPAVASGGTHTFAGATAGYSAISPTAFTITNTGIEDMGDLAVNLSGSGASSFTLVATGLDSELVSGNTTSFTIKPNDSLAAGTYTATVTITDTNITSYTFTISFTVSASSGGGDSTTYTVTFDLDGGTRTGGGALSQSVASGGSATAPTAERDGYTFDGWDKPLTGITTNTTITAQWKPVSDVTPITPEMPVNLFEDIKGADWFIDDVIYVYHKGLMTGTSTSPILFSPYANTTRDMIVTILYRLEGEPSVAGLDNPFTDLPAGQWYTDAVIWAVSKGIVTGYDNGLFGTNDDITRQDLAVILMRYVDFAGLTLPILHEYVGFLDEADIADYAKDAVEELFKAGIIDGKTGNIFDPKGDATRAEVAAMLHRFLEAVEE